LGLILLLRATYLLPTEYKGGFCRYDVIDLTTKLPTVARAESEFSNLKADFKTSANALKADGADRRPVPTPERTMSPVKHESRALVGGAELENFRWPLSARKETLSMASQRIAFSPPAVIRLARALMAGIGHNRPFV
jgi:hypothetical protein